MPPTKAIDSSSIELKALRTTIYNCTWNEINTDSPNKKMPKVQNANNPSKFGMKTYYPITTAVITMNHGPRVPNPLIKSSSASKQIYHPRVVCGRGGGVSRDHGRENCHHFITVQPSYSETNDPIEFDVQSPNHPYSTPVALPTSSSQSS